MDRAIVSAIAKNQLMRIPPLARHRDRRFHRRGYVPAKNRAEYARWTFENCAKQVRERRAISGTAVEVGPGGNLATALLFAEAGCERVICIDVFDMLTDQEDLYRELSPDADALLERIDYRCPDSIESTSLQDGSVDIIFSNACLEHVADPAAACRRMAALLRPGGVMTHGIDLRDHRDFERPLEFLRYPDRVWHAASSRRIYTNRWRASDWRRGLEAAGLSQVVVEPQQQVEVSDAQRATFDDRFAERTSEDLSTVLIEATASKPT